jgi:hypothetical protein
MKFLVDNAFSPPVAEGYAKPDTTQSTFANTDCKRLKTRKLFDRATFEERFPFRQTWIFWRDPGSPKQQQQAVGNSVPAAVWKQTERAASLASY